MALPIALASASSFNAAVSFGIGTDGQVHEITTQTGQDQGPINPQPLTTTTGYATSPDGQTLYVVGTEGSVNDLTAVNITTQGTQNHGPYIQLAGTPVSVSASPDGKYIVVGETDASGQSNHVNFSNQALIEVFSTADGNPALTQILSPQGDPAMTSPTSLATTSTATGALQIVESGGASIVGNPGSAQPSYVFTLTFNNGPNPAITTASILTASDGNPNPTTTYSSGAAISGDGKFAWLLTGSNAVAIVDLTKAANGGPLQSALFSSNGGKPLNIAVSPDGKRIYVAYINDSSASLPGINWAVNIGVIDTPSEGSTTNLIERNYTFNSTTNFQTSDVPNISVSPDGSMLYVADDGQTVLGFNTAQFPTSTTSSTSATTMTPTIRSTLVTNGALPVVFAGVTTQVSVNALQPTTVPGAPASFQATITATNTSVYGPPTGTVTFTDLAPDGSTQIIGTTNVSTNSSGVTTASITTSSPLPAGRNSVSATYNGDLTYDYSTTSSPALQSVVATTNTAFTSIIPNGIYGHTALSKIQFTVTSNQTVVQADGSIAAPNGGPSLSMNGSQLRPTSITSSPGSTNSQTIFTFTFSQPVIPPAGTDTLTASYPWEPLFQASSASQTFVVESTTSIAISYNPPGIPSAGSVVEVIATVTSDESSAGTPQGTVQFNFGGPLTLPLNSNGVAAASFTVPNNPQPISVTYEPPPSPLGPWQPTQASQATVSLSAGASTALYGTTTTLTANINAGTQGKESLPLAGQVAFYDNGALLSSVPANGATVKYSTVLPVGTHALTAAFTSANALPGSGMSPASKLTISPLRTTTTINPLPNPWAPGQAVQLSATVVDVNNQPVTSGNVTFTATAGRQSSTSLGTAPLDSTGTAVIDHVSLNTAGSYQITATYSPAAGDSTHLSSLSNASATVQLSNVKVSLTSKPNPAVSGTDPTVTFTVNVTATGGGATPPAGNVVLCDFGANNPAGNSNFTTCQSGSTQIAGGGSGSLTNGQVSFQVPVSGTPGGNSGTGLSDGTHNLIAQFSSTAGSTFSGGVSNALQQLVQVNPTMAFTATPQPTTSTDVSLTATMSGGLSSPPQGTIEFTDVTNPSKPQILFDSNNNSQIALTTDSGGNTSTATLDIHFLALGAHQYQAQYTADPTSTAYVSGATQNITVNVSSGVASTGLTVTLDPAPASTPQGQPVTLTAHVSDANVAAPPSGSVTFEDSSTILSDAGGNRSFTVKADPSNTSDVIAQMTTSSLPPGTHQVDAVFMGQSTDSTNPYFNTTATSSPITVVIERAQPTVTVTSSGSPSSTTQPPTFTATVTGPSSLPTPTGTAVFNVFDSNNNAVSLGSAATQPLDQGSATFTPQASQLPAGKYTVSVTYSGDSTYAQVTSATIPQVVGDNAAVTSTTVSAQPASPSPSGANIKFTATVTAIGSMAGTQPQGTVEFQDGTKVLAQAQSLQAGITAGTVTATYTTTTPLAVGTHTITATFNGSGTFAGDSSSQSLQQVVNGGAASTTSLSADHTTVTSGQTVTFTATVTGGSGPPTGTVDIKDGTTTLATQLALKTGSTSGTATVPFTTASLGAGSHTITAVYSGDTTYAPSTSTAITVTVNGHAGLSVTTTSLPNATVGTAYKQTLAATGGASPYTWAVSKGTLPAGLGLNKTTGAITGTPSAASTAALTFTVTDSSEPALSATKALTLTVATSGGSSKSGGGSGSTGSTGGGSSSSHSASPSSSSGSPGNSGSTGGSGGSSSTSSPSPSVANSLAHTGATIVAPALLAVLLVGGGVFLYRRYRE